MLKVPVLRKTFKGPLPGELVTGAISDVAGTVLIIRDPSTETRQWYTDDTYYIAIDPRATPPAPGENYHATYFSVHEKMGFIVKWYGEGTVSLHAGGPEEIGWTDLLPEISFTGLKRFSFVTFPPVGKWFTFEPRAHPGSNVFLITVRRALL